MKETQRRGRQSECSHVPPFAPSVARWGVLLPWQMQQADTRCNVLSFVPRLALLEAPLTTIGSILSAQ
jgi:hypothetical protein